MATVRTESAAGVTLPSHPFRNESKPAGQLTAPPIMQRRS